MMMEGYLKHCVAKAQKVKRDLATMKRNVTPDPRHVTLVNRLQMDGDFRREREMSPFLFASPVPRKHKWHEN